MDSSDRIRSLIRELRELLVQEKIDHNHPLFLEIIGSMEGLTIVDMNLPHPSMSKDGFFRVAQMCSALYQRFGRKFKIAFRADGVDAWEELPSGIVVPTEFKSTIECADLTDPPDFVFHQGTISRLTQLLPCNFILGTFGRNADRTEPMKEIHQFDVGSWYHQKLEKKLQIARETGVTSGNTVRLSRVRETARRLI